MRARAGRDDAVIYYCSSGTWSCPRWEAEVECELPSQKDIPGSATSVASSLSATVCVCLGCCLPAELLQQKCGLGAVLGS